MPKTHSTSALLPPTYPIHHVIRDKTRSEEDIMRFLRAAFAADPTCIGRPDSAGQQPLTVAIAVENLAAVNTLVELASPGMAQGDDPLGLQVPNEQQETPLAYNVRLLRESPRFVMHDLLDDASRDITKAFVKHKLPACTCGKCTPGWLSARMRFRLRETAHDIYTAMLPKLDQFSDGQPLDNAVVLEDTPLQFIPETILQKGIYKPFYIGYRCAFHTIRCFLTNTDNVPTVQRLRQELAAGARDGKYDSASVEYFLEKGGSVKYALDMVVHLAACLSGTCMGDGTFDRKWDEQFLVPDIPLGTPLAPCQSIASSVLTTRDSELMKRRRRSSVRDLLGALGKKERMSALLEVQQDNETQQLRKFKDEWLTSGDPGCALDDQFTGVRYLVGLHSAPRWDVDGHNCTVVKRECQLRRM